MKNTYLTSTFEDAGATLQRIEAAFGTLSGAQLNWKPSAETWSVGQCLDHLISSDEEYFSQLKAIAAGEKGKSFWEAVPLLPRFWGSFIRKAVHPDSQRKNKTFAVFEPSASNLPETIVSDFKAHHRELIDLITATDHVDHEKVILTSPVARFMTYSLKDAVIILVTHMERHYRQAKAVTERDGFPGD